LFLNSPSEGAVSPGRAISRARWSVHVMRLSGYTAYS
jgi:hypothetical protein